ncbi:MAG: hypothetical protein JXA00_04580, partial [Candidatus Thermoplasmatota archaeon]|nr:hypothetical protein [Candidatus Thermoplasmatota archaeon]
NRIAVTGTTTTYKEDYFNTMFYQAYIGYPPQQDQSGALQVPQQQIPCYGMKHFIPVYVSPYPYYGQGRSAVIIAKYFEGAFFNGTISCNSTPLQYVHVSLLDQYEFPHDNMFTNEKGLFNVLAPADNITLLFTYADDVFLKTITFNNTSSLLYPPLTDAEAMRMNGTNYTRFFNITVNLSTLEGYVYEDNNNNGSYEPSIDTPLSGITIELQDYYFGRPVPSTTTDAQGHYLFQNLYPSKYNISAIEDGYTLLERRGINVEPDENMYNISKPKLAAINGVVYRDTDDDFDYTAGEEVSGVNVELTYTTLDGTQITVGTKTTDATGSYSFASLVPGRYSLNATQLNSITGYLDYLSTEPVTPTANRTSWVNISLDYAPVIVSGYTTHNTEKVDAVTLTFAPDASVENNTAVQKTATSDATGFYSLKLTPGSYNLSARQTSGSTTVYSATGHLVVTIGQGRASYPVALTKDSITVTGHTTYNGMNKANMTITFTPDFTVENNTALYTTVMTDSTGAYTIELTAGSYNVSVEELVNESGQNVTYTGASYIAVQTGDAPRTLTIILTREET